jgi:hypothetical protein
MPLQVMRKRPVQDRTVPLQTETTNARICTSTRKQANLIREKRSSGYHLPELSLIFIPLKA